MKRTIITVGREFGSGGRLIAKLIAEKLSVPFYDKKLIEMAAVKSGLSPEYIQEAEQKKTTSFLYNLYFSSQNLPISDQVFLAESEVIRQVAAEGPCVIVGRCANYVLRERTDCVHVFIHAPLEKRVCRATDVYNIRSGDVHAYVLRQDKARASYYNHFTTGRWGMCKDYDLSISSELGVEAAATLIEELARHEKVDQ